MRGDWWDSDRVGEVLDEDFLNKGDGVFGISEVVILCSEFVILLLSPVGADSEGESLCEDGLTSDEFGTIGDPSFEGTSSTIGEESCVEDAKINDWSGSTGEAVRFFWPSVGEFFRGEEKRFFCSPMEDVSPADWVKFFEAIVGECL